MAQSPCLHRVSDTPAYVLLGDRTLLFWDPRRDLRHKIQDNVSHRVSFSALRAVGESYDPRSNSHRLGSARWALEGSLAAPPQHLHWQKEHTNTLVCAGWPWCYQKCTAHGASLVPSSRPWNSSAGCAPPSPLASTIMLQDLHRAVSLHSL